jgi:hypothetical protein
MRAPRALAAVLALALAASARAAAPVRLILPGEGLAPACPSCGALVLPAAAAAAPTPAVSPVPVLQPVAPAPAALPPAPAPPAEFASAAPAVDGAAFYPPVQASPASLGPQAEHRVETVRAAAVRALAALRESVARGGWNGPGTTLDGPCCGDAAPKLAVMLRARGIPARLIEGEFHYYVAVDLPEGPIVVDPTVRQFFGRKDAPSSVPTVFVGTVGQLNALFARHRAAKATRYDPSRIYFSDARVRETKLRILDRLVREGDRDEHEPLRRFLAQVPPPAPPAPGLIVP